MELQTRGFELIRPKESLLLSRSFSYSSNYNETDQNVLHLASFIYRRKKCRAIISSSSIVIEYESSPNIRTIIPLEDVINAWPCYCSKPNKNVNICECIKDASSYQSNFLNIDDEVSSGENLKISLIRLFHATPVGKFAWKQQMIALEPAASNDQTSLYEWINAIRSVIEDFDRPRKLLVFVNPFGGKRKAPTIFYKKIDPLFRVAGVKIECVTTERANHAKEFIQNFKYDLMRFDGIVCVGGDGMFAEVLNGLLIKTQKDARVNWSSTNSRLVSPSIPIGVIPAGSTDAVAHGTTGVNDPITSTLLIVLGKKINIDVCAIHHRDEERLVRYATSFLGYGFFGDTIADSERNRWLGPRRYDWAGIKKFLGHRLYNGEIKFCISPKDGSPRDKTICAANCENCKSALNNNNPMNDKDYSCISIRGRFLAINVATMSCRCGMSKKGISPSAHLGNGCADLIVVSQCSRINYLKYLLRIGYSSKSSFDFGFVDAYRVREFEFSPIIGPSGSSKKYQSANASVWNCDGEVVNVPAVHIKVHCQLVTIFGTGIEIREKSSQNTKFRLN